VDDLVSDLDAGVPQWVEHRVNTRSHGVARCSRYEAQIEVAPEREQTATVPTNGSQKEWNMAALGARRFEDGPNESICEVGMLSGQRNTAPTGRIQFFYQRSARAPRVVAQSTLLDSICPALDIRQQRRLNHG
jgi:hypothetical protein